MAEAKFWGGRDTMNEGGDGVVKVLRSRGFGQIEKSEIKIGDLTIWWEMKFGKYDLTEDEVEGIIAEFRSSIEDRVRDKEQQV